MKIAFIAFLVLITGTLGNTFYEAEPFLQSHHSVYDTKTDVLQFVEGFLNGVSSASAFAQIRNCIGDGAAFISEVSQAIEDIKSKNAAQVKEGIELLGQAAQIIPAAAKACTASVDEVKDLVKLVESFQSPIQFLYYVGKSLIINHVDVLNEVSNAITAYEDKNWNQLGYWVGKAMDTIILGQPENIGDLKSDITAFAEGFVNGVASADLFSQIESCIQDTETFTTDVVAAVGDIKSKDPARVKTGILLLGQAASIIPNAATACKASAADVASFVKLVETFTSPSSFLYYIGKSLLINHVEVINEVEQIVSSFEASNYNQVGYWTGKTMDTIILGEPKEEFVFPADTKTDVLQFVEGFLNGVSSASAFAQIRNCIGDGAAFISEVSQAIEDIKSKNAAQVKEGIELLGQAAQIIPAAAKACTASVDEVKDLVKLVESFSSPIQFLYYVGKSLIINHVDVLNEVSNAITAYEDKNWNQLGYWVGKAMDTIILGQPKEEVVVVVDTKTDILNFVEGLLTGIGSASAFDQVRACVTDSEDIITDLANAVGDIKSKDPVRVKNGIVLIGQAAQIVPDAVQECKAGAVDLKTLLKMIESFQSPVSFLYYIGKSLLINHVEVLKEVENAVDGYFASNFTALGYWVGAAMDTIVLGQDQTLTQDFADFLNKKASWKAAVPSKFEGMTLREISSRYLGANLVDNTRFDNVTVYDYEGVTDVPASFNASEQWPGCIHPIRDQAQCGSCWAFAASEVLSDRFCIASNGSVNVILSPQYLLSCNNILDHGCNGGTPLFSWWFIGTDGLVTDSCLPYASGNGTNPIKCKDFTACADGTPLKKYYGKAPASLNNPASIQANLLQYGPVEAAMTVYQDFMYYTGGIYTHTSGSELGGHAIKITGWGNENGQNYWIVANSWGPTWGENGFFRIAWGQCGIDSACIAGQADLTKTMMSENKFW